MEDFYALLIRPEDGETWGNVPWMDEAWIAKNTIDEEVPSWLAAFAEDARNQALARAAED
jgi:hypothetical protein